MKKVSSLIVAFVMASSVFLSSTAFAASASVVVTKEQVVSVPAKDSAVSETTKISKEKALEIAKTVLPAAPAYEQSNISLESNWSYGGKVWNINMYMKTSPGGNANVSVDAETGEILSFNVWEGYNGTQNFIAKITRSEAQVKAEEYIKNQLKEDIGTFELQKEDPNTYNYSYNGVKSPVIYNYIFIKKINGILFANNNINIGVDGTTGEVKSFYRNIMNYAKLEFPDVKNVISAETALEKFKASCNVVLQYVPIYEYKPYGGSNQKIIPAYVPGSYVYMLDAVSGKVLNYDGSVLAADSTAFKNLMEKPVAMVPGSKLTSKKLTDDQAKQMAEKYKSIIEGACNIKFEDSNNGMNGSNSSLNGIDNIWSYYWYKNKANGSTNFNISISATTGHITNLGFGDYDYNMPAASKDGGMAAAVKEKYNWSKAKEKALAMVKKVLPEQYGSFVDENIMEPQMDENAKKTMREYSFAFTRLANGIRVRDNTINISVDRETGAIRNLYFNWNDREIPAVTNVISREDASNKYFGQSEAKLSYFVKTTYNKSGAPVIGNKPQLIYMFSSAGSVMGYGNIVVDALDGRLLDYAGVEIKTAAAGDANLGENWAKRSAELLIAQGILKKGFEFDAGVTRYEAVKMLSTAKGLNYYDPAQITTTDSFKDVAKSDDYYTFVESAVSQKIITADGSEFKGSEKITASEFTKLLVNFLGYADIAKHGDVFKTTGMTNISDDMAGYAAVCKAFDILPVKNTDAFDGKAELTYAMAANALYKALSFAR